MTTFSQMILDIFREEGQPTRVLARILTHKLQSQGYVTEEKYEDALSHIEFHLKELEAAGKLSGDKANISLPLESILGETINQEEIRLAITDEEIELYSDRLEGLVAETTKEAISEFSENLAQSWRQAFAKELLRIRDNRKTFSRILNQAWGEALDKLDLFIDLCLTLGEQFNTNNRTQATIDQDFRFDALTRIHARSCQVAGEIYTLLSSGFADGATARWRTLHELAVFSVILANNDAQTAERFLLHSAIEDHKLRQASGLRYMDFTSMPAKSNLLSSKKRADMLSAQYGSVFDTEYGWASHLFNDHRVTLAQLQTLADRDNFNFPVKLAHKYVHASAFGTLFPLGAPPGEHNMLMLAGVSVFGLCEPAKQSSQALALVTSNLLMLKSDGEEMISLQALLRIRDEVWDSFNETETYIERENGKLNGRKIRNISIVAKLPNL